MLSLNIDYYGCLFVVLPANCLIAISGSGLCNSGDCDIAYVDETGVCSKTDKQVSNYGATAHTLLSPEA